ncbi:ATP:cob(I)alamin adenosyltransferase [Entomomonas asaccharolytica]|uniref:ATP:cob(I)alamin adenosyltransferase n=1 Tax=Entomomonas asaccharolytica TaxID=2785331 RepID=A0A974RYY4_9GAMM|nr:ATP:cob(I)alamin adenosyltransferase [Entomomonas asaccharolytica]
MTIQYLNRLSDVLFVLARMQINNKVCQKLF